MKKIIIVLVVGVLWTTGILRGQTNPTATQKAEALSGQAAKAEKPKAELQRFDLDFPGGTPVELVAAIEEASKKPVNAIIPNEHREIQIPALKMRGVTLPELFEAVGSASQKLIYIKNSGFAPMGTGFQQYNTAYGFKTSGSPRADSIWYFYNLAPPQLPAELSNQSAICRFFQLEPYLQSYTIEDITTALETGWKMLGQGASPKLSFHKDTRLLIVVGEPDKLAMIDQLLQQLPRKAKEPAATSQKEPAPAKGGELKNP